MSQGLTKKNVKDILSVIGYVVFTAVVVLTALFFVGLLPVKPVAVATGSMEPTIMVGDMAVVSNVECSELSEGDVIQFQRDGYTVIHRIADVQTDTDGSLQFITRGDNNDSDDDKPVSESDVMGRVLFSVPKLGLPSLWLNGVLE